MLRSGRVCPSCGRLKPLSAFPTNKRGKSEFGRTRSTCRRCHALRHYGPKFGLRPIDRFRLWHLQDRRCFFCGEAMRLVESELDHDHGNEEGPAGGARALVHPVCNLLIGSHDVASAAMLVNYLSRKRYPAVVVWRARQREERKRHAR